VIAAKAEPTRIACRRVIPDGSVGFIKTEASVDGTRLGKERSLDLLLRADQSTQPPFRRTRIANCWENSPRFSFNA